MAKSKTIFSKADDGHFGLAPDRCCAPPLPPPRSVLSGTLTVKEALQLDAMKIPVFPKETYLKKGDQLDPVLQAHLHRTTL
jgi:hypothetical protein